jgi:O-antigen ligase
VRPRRDVIGSSGPRVTVPRIAPRVRHVLTSADARAATLGFALVVVAGADDGGYFRRTWVWLGLGLVAVAALALLLGGEVAIGRLEVAMLASLAALTGWILLSGLWGIEGADAVLEAERALLYLVALAALVLVVESEATTALLGGVLAGITVLVSYGLVDWLVSEEADPFQGTLLGEPVGYANALGILAAIGLLLALGLGWARRRLQLLLLPALALSVALVLTESRGAWLAFAVGLAVLVLLHAPRARLWGAIVVAGVAVVVVAAVTSPRISLGDRSEYWEAAFDDVRDRPLGGSGAGSFEEYWLEHGDPGVHVQDAHSLYLEVLAELGIVGFALVLVVLAVPFIALVRTRRDIESAAAAGFTAFVVHAGLDWDWEMPVVVFTGLACAVALLVATRPARD